MLLIIQHTWTEGCLSLPGKVVNLSHPQILQQADDNLQHQIELSQASHPHQSCMVKKIYNFHQPDSKYSQHSS